MVNEWRWIDKTGWRGVDPDEPDAVQWIDDYTGFRCMISRAQVTGSLCGYVGIPLSHPLHNKSYDTKLIVPDSWVDNREGTDSDRTPIVELFCHVFGEEEYPKVALFLDVHGGITYSQTTGDLEWWEWYKENAPEQWTEAQVQPQTWMLWVDEDGIPNETFWYGFDASHHMDMSPGIAKTLDDLHEGEPDRKRNPFWGTTYRDVKYMMDECTNLAAQIKRTGEMLEEGVLNFAPTSESDLH